LQQAENSPRNLKPNIYKLNEMRGQPLEHSEHNTQPVNNYGEGIYETCEDSFACNLIYFSPVSMPDLQLHLRSSFTSSENVAAQQAIIA